MPAELLAHLKKVWVAGQRLRISRDTGKPEPASPHAPHAGNKPPKKKRF